METITQAIKQTQSFIPLGEETRETLPTNAAAFHLNRADTTLRAWACLRESPIRPVRINGRLAWRVSDIKKLLAEGSAK